MWSLINLEWIGNRDIPDSESQLLIMSPIAELIVPPWMMTFEN